ncbi:RHS repeat-associated core domain-containing protein [Chitinivorax sp. B]|uniref:RHS repeat-associated core domain-containing protein n=1 Tax=Chitinivorax sp. B TaxID=2502235 RepID=UPI0010F83A0F|nr:RHS repeat-associated core domain-containing protein [Chitinivorax sp. B]
MHGGAIDDPLLRITSQGTQTYHGDGLGSIVGLSNAQGLLQAWQQFDAWGNRLNGQGDIPQYGYTGREPDVAGLVYYRARWYDPSIGRFTQRDPIGLQGGINQYGYVDADPINLVDPYGLYASPSSGGYNVASGYGGTIKGAAATGRQASIVLPLPDMASGSQRLGGASQLPEPIWLAKEICNGCGTGATLPGVPIGLPPAAYAIPVRPAAAVRSASTLQANKAAGDAFEQQVLNQTRQTQSNVVQQLTVKMPSGVKTRIDIVGRDSKGNIVCTECKASQTAPLTKNQKKAFPEIKTSGATVVGNGKPGYPGGTVIPPTDVDIVRP